jgi:tRNA (adenine37-N6)-methyltransferase
LAESAPGDIQIRPIGVIHTPFPQGKDAPRQGVLGPVAEGTIEIRPEFEAGLADLAGFSHVHLVFAFHRSLGYDLRIVPGGGRRKRGLFSTRSPRRPNPIGMTVVRLLSVEGATLRVSGVDMIDGTPLLDIKPYVPALDVIEGAGGGWTEESRRARGGA